VTISMSLNKNKRQSFTVFELATWSTDDGSSITIPGVRALVDSRKRSGEEDDSEDWLA
jgi:hypothetical protein